MIAKPEVAEKRVCRLKFTLSVGVEGGRVVVVAF